jgi:hypothetical protein
MPRIDPNNWFKRAIVRGMREAAKKGRLRLVEEPWAQFARAPTNLRERLCGRLCSPFLGIAEQVDGLMEAMEPLLWLLSASEHAVYTDRVPENMLVHNGLVQIDFEAVEWAPAALDLANLLAYMDYSTHLWREGVSCRPQSCRPQRRPAFTRLGYSRRSPRRVVRDAKQLFLQHTCLMEDLWIEQENCSPGLVMTALLYPQHLKCFAGASAGRALPRNGARRARKDPSSRRLVFYIEDKSHWNFHPAEPSRRTRLA